MSSRHASARAHRSPPRPAAAPAAEDRGRVARAGVEGAQPAQPQRDGAGHGDPGRLPLRARRPRARTSWPRRDTCSSIRTTSPRKGRELAENPRAALVMHWDHLHRQVRVEGRIVKAPESDSDAYFSSRASPAAWAHGPATRASPWPPGSCCWTRSPTCRKRFGIRDASTPPPRFPARRIGAAIACGRKPSSCGSKAMRAFTTARAGRAR